MNRPNPFYQILLSRKTWWAVLSLVGVLLAHYSGLPTEVQASILALGVAMIGSIAWEDSAAKGASVMVQADRVGEVGTTNTTEVKS